MQPKTDHQYIQIDDKDYDVIYYHCQQTDEQVLEDSNDLLPEKRINKRYLSLFRSIVGILLGLSFVSILTIICNKYTFGINISNSLTESVWNKFALNDKNHNNQEMPLSPFEKAVTVETQCAKMIGVVEENAFAFKGIPYALPPIGALRWSRPIAVNKDDTQCQNDNYFHANHFAFDCLQYNSSINQIIGDENCLYLNVWTPRLDDSANLNVLLYIHGGLEEGSANRPFGPNGRLSHKLNSVLISINYRLNAFGFLSLDLLANSNANSSHGNYGVWDVIIAIDWIKTNIHAFGGDSNKITVFGPDGDLIIALISNYEYSGLIKSAWISGSKFYLRPTFAQQSKINRKNFLMKTNCSLVQCLKSLSGKEVLEIYNQNLIRNTNFSFIVTDEEIVISEPNEDKSETALLIDLKSKNNSIVYNLTNVFSEIYLYNINNYTYFDENSTYEQKSDQFFQFFTSFNQIITNHNFLFGDELQKLLMSFVNINHEYIDSFNTTAITLLKVN